MARAKPRPQRRTCTIRHSTSLPARLIAGIVTEFGVARPPYEESLADLDTRPNLW